MKTKPLDKYLIKIDELFSNNNYSTEFSYIFNNKIIYISLITTNPNYKSIYKKILFCYVATIDKSNHIEFGEIRFSSQRNRMYGPFKFFSELISSKNLHDIFRKIYYSFLNNKWEIYIPRTKDKKIINLFFKTKNKNKIEKEIFPKGMKISVIKVFKSKIYYNPKLISYQDVFLEIKTKILGKLNENLQLASK